MFETGRMPLGIGPSMSAKPMPASTGNKSMSTMPLPIKKKKTGGIERPEAHPGFADMKQGIGSSLTPKQPPMNPIMPMPQPMPNKLPFGNTTKGPMDMGRFGSIFGGGLLGGMSGGMAPGMMGGLAPSGEMLQRLMMMFGRSR